MSRKQRCYKCNKWYYNHNGLFIVLPDTYDDNMCPECNREIDSEIAQRQKMNQQSLDKGEE